LFILKSLAYFVVIFRRVLMDFSSLEKSKCEILISDFLTSFTYIVENE